MFSSADLTKAMRAISSSLQTPVIVILLILVACAVILIGSLIAEYFTEHRYLKVQMPKMVDALRACRMLSEKNKTAEGTGNEISEETGQNDETMIEKCIQNGGLLKRQRKVLLEVTRHPELTDSMREALAVQLLEAEQSHYDTIVKLSEIVVRLGPVFGLLGTLIPLGPGLIALGQGDTYTLSQSLLIAFDTTVIGLISAAGATVVTTFRKKWYGNYMSVLEALTECLLEVEKNDESAA